MAKKAKKQKLVWLDERRLQISYPSIGKVLIADTSKYGESIDVEARCHGYKQKFGDAKSGKTASEKYADAVAIDRSLLEGEWARTVTPDLTPLICLAVSRIKGQPLAKVEKAAEKAGADAVKEWGTDVKVKAEILKIRSERLAKEAEEAEELEIDFEDDAE